ncbi:MAG TPA: hypothetical protein VH063_04745 [Gaiellaceae bacterium]|jgi:hypothetical protein|nr:hypothetical protein [Gaiellaceae bacterium]
MADSAAAESWIDLPSFVDEPIAVYVNGIEQQVGTDFELRERAIVFPRELVPEVKMKPFQWVLVTVGIGAYKKHDSVDVIYEHGGRRLVASGLPIRTDDEESYVT